MTRRHAADSWHATATQRLNQVTAAILDLIDCGIPDTPTRRRRPSNGEQATTDRPDGNFHPTTPGPTSRPGGTHSDATAAAVLAWERQVQAATTGLYATVAAAQEIVDGLGLIPIDEHGQPLTAPNEPATRTTLSGRQVVDIAPRQCRQSTLEAVAYLAAVADRVADRLAAAEGDVADAVASRAHWLEHAIVRLAFRLVPPAHPAPAPVEQRRVRRCACDWSECPHGPGGCGNETPDRTCGTCRNRKSAARRAAS